MTVYRSLIVFEGKTWIVAFTLNREGNEIIVSLSSAKQATIFGQPIPELKRN